MTQERFNALASAGPVISAGDSTAAFVSGELGVTQVFGLRTADVITVVERASGDGITTADAFRSRYNTPLPVDSLSLDEDGPILAYHQDISTVGPYFEIRMVDTASAPGAGVPNPLNADGSQHVLAGELLDGGTDIRFEDLSMSIGNSTSTTSSSRSMGAARRTAS